MVVVDMCAMRECVKQSGLKQKYIAERIGIAEKTLSYVLTSRSKCTVGVYAGLCNVLGKPLSEFIRHDERVRIS